MTWTWALLIASATGFTAFGFILCALLTWPELPEREHVPEHPQVDGEAAHYWVGANGWATGGNVYDQPRHLTLVPPPAQFIDAQALGWLEGA